MLERLVVQNFQSLRDVDLELAPFTVIVGRSNSGKSALRRALQGLVTNAPASGRLRKGETELRVIVSTELGGEATWAKGSKVNAYVVDGVNITKPGAKAPEAVDKLLALSDINFAGQFDAPFLLMETPSAVANRLGKLTNVNLLFDGIREAERQRKAAASEAKTLDQELVFHQAVFDEAMEVLPTWQAKLTEQGNAILAAQHAKAEADLATDAVDRVNALRHVIMAAEASLVGAVPTLPSTTLLEQANLLGSALVRARAHAAVLARPMPPMPPPMPLYVEGASDAIVAARDRSRTAYNAYLQAGANLIKIRQDLTEVDAELATIKTCPTCGALSA